MTKIPPLEKIEVEIGTFATNFLRAYLEFLGNKQPIEEICREILYDGILELRDHIRGIPFSKGLFEKYPHIFLLDSPKDREESEESDC